MTKRPVEQQQEASAFYAARNVDVSYYPALWHTFKVGQLMTTDLDRICRNYGLSIADAHMMGAIRIERPTPVRATDLAQILNVSNAALSTRVAALEEKGLLERRPSEDDHRAVTLTLTPKGIGALDSAINAIGEQAHFVECFRQLSEADQKDLGRIMGQMHDLLDRNFLSATR
jgi:DNA-binding MarR family transcriptional regulator